MKNVSKYMVSAKKHLRTDKKYDIASDEIQELKNRSNVSDVADIDSLIEECFYFGFECGRRYEKNKKG